jgi:FAD/FMN-containing dehydrogenase
MSEVRLDELDVGQLAERVGDRLLRVVSALRPCQLDSSSPACSAVLQAVANPYFLQEDPGGFQTTGWLGAFVTQPSLYAVAAETPEDIAAAVTFARDRQARVVIKGTGHDYLGRSSAPGSLLVWTHRMREITVHQAFVPMGSSDIGFPAVTVGAGARWLEVYQAVTLCGRYVQGGGCTSVGATGGFTQGGGFGSFSKRFGTAAGNVVEIEVVLRTERF